MSRLHRMVVGLVAWAQALVLVFAWGASADAEPATWDLGRVETEHYTLEHAEGLAPAARRLAQDIEAWHTRIYAELGADASTHATISVLHDEREMFALVADRQPGSRPPEWAAGLAFPQSRTIYLRADTPMSELLVTTQHEISHVALGEAAGPGRVPIWFTEGVAIRQSEPLAIDRIWLLTEASLADRLLPLDDLVRGFPVNGQRAGVAYAQSVHFIGFLISKMGAPRFQALLAGLRETAHGGAPVPFQAVVAETYGRPLATIEAEWRDSLSFWWGWIPVVFAGASFWFLLGVVLVAAWRKRRREQARRMRDLAGLEAVDMAEDIEIAHDLRPPPRAHDPYHGRPPSVH